jgi:hypothetical protein
MPKTIVFGIGHFDHRGGGLARVCECGSQDDFGMGSAAGVRARSKVIATRRNYTFGLTRLFV